MKHTSTKTNKLNCEERVFVNMKLNIADLKQQREDLIARLELSREYGAPSPEKVRQEGVYENQLKRTTLVIIEAENTLIEMKRGQRANV